MAKEKKRLKVQTADRRIKEHQSAGGKWLKVPAGTTFFNPKETKTIRVTVVPYEVTEKGNPHCDPGYLYGERTAWCHFGIGPNQGSYVCNAKTYNTKCPVCEYRANLMKKGGDEEQIKALAPKERQLWNVVDHKAEDKGVQLWDVSYHLFGKFLDNVINEAEPEEKDQFRAYVDPEEGCVIKATPIAKPNGRGGTFNEFSNIQLMPRSKPVNKEWLDAALNLDKLVPPVDYDELKKVFLQTEDEAIDDEEDDKDDSDDDDEDEDDKPTTRSGKAKPKVEEEEDDEEEEEEEDDDPSAEDMGIEVGVMVTHKKWGTCKVTKVSGDGTSVRVKDKGGKGEERNGIAPKDLKVVKADSDDDDEDDEDDDEPALKKPAGKKPAAKDDNDDEPLDDADDDDEEEEEEEDDDEPVKKPAAKKPAAKKAADDDDDDEDVEPAPKRGRGRSPGSKNKK